MAIVKTYSDKVNDPISEKAILALLEPSQRAITWTLDSGAIYVRTPDFYVIDTKIDTTSLTEASSTSLSSGEWFFDSEAGVTYIRLSDDSDPKDSFISLTFRLFMSDAPYILTHDLTETGDEVEFDARVKNNPSFPQEIDDANQLGIALESSGSLTLENNDSFWEPYFDKLFWEDKRVALYSWFPDTKFSEAQQIFEGTIEDKRYDELNISFRLKDQIIKLRQKIDLSFFSTSDGDISDNILGTPKRRIYGDVTGIKTQSIDQTLGGFSLTGTITGTDGSPTVSGSGTDFLDELSPGDQIKFVVDTTTTLITVETIETDISFTASTDIDSDFSGLSATNIPDVPYRRKNRSWHISGHKLREPSTTIATVEQNNRVVPADITDFTVNDEVKVDGSTNTIKRITQGSIVFFQNLVNPTVGQTIIRNPVNKVTFKKLEFVLDRDYTVGNVTAESKIVFNSLAEFNVTPERKIIGTVTFTGSSRTIGGSGTKFLSNFKSRDWIVSGDLTHQTFYEILQVEDDTTMKIRIAYAGATTSSGTPRRKDVNYINDDSFVIVDSYGMERSGAWVKTASDVVKDILENDASITNLNTSSFSTADIEAPYTMALKLPLTKGGAIPKVRDAINICNKSVFGSLVARNDATIAYNILSPEKPTDLEELTDEDIVSFNVKTRTNIFRKINTRYNFFDADVNTEENGNALLEITTMSSFVDNLIGSKKEDTIDVHLKNTAEAEIIGERYAFYHSLTQSVVEVKGKMNLMLKNINDKLFLNLDRLYQRYGSTIRKKIGIVSKIRRSGQNVDVDFTDLSGIFARVGTIGEDTSSDFSSASETEKMITGYVVDYSTELPDSSATTDDEFGINLVG